MPTIQGKEVTDEELEKSLDALSKGGWGETAVELGRTLIGDPAMEKIRAKIKPNVENLTRGIKGIDKNATLKKWGAPHGARAINGGIYNIKDENGVHRLQAYHADENTVHLHQPKEDVKEGDEENNYHKIMTHKEFDSEVGKSERNERSNVHLLSSPKPDWGENRNKLAKYLGVNKSQDTDTDVEFLEEIFELQKSAVDLANLAITHAPLAHMHLQNAINALHPLLHAAGIHPAASVDAVKEAGKAAVEGAKVAAEGIKKFSETGLGGGLKGAATAFAAKHAVDVGSAIKMRGEKTAHQHNIHPSSWEKHHFNESPAEEGHTYRINNNYYHAEAADHTHTTMRINNPNKIKKGVNEYEVMSHKQLGKKLDSGEIEHVELPSNGHSTEKSLSIMAKETPEVFTPTVNDKVIDHTGSVFILKSIDNGMYTMERDGRPTAALQEREYMRFINTPGTVIRRSGKRISL